MRCGTPSDVMALCLPTVDDTVEGTIDIAALFLTTEAVIVDKPEEKGAPAMPGRGMADF